MTRNAVRRIGVIGLLLHFFVFPEAVAGAERPVPSTALMERLNAEGRAGSSLPVGESLRKRRGVSGASAAFSDDADDLPLHDECARHPYGTRPAQSE